MREAYFQIYSGYSMVRLRLANKEGVFLFSMFVNTRIRVLNNEVVLPYFHGKQRCKTCMAVEQVTQETIDQLYGNNQKVRYKEVLFDEVANKALVEKYAVTWSTLLVVKGGDYTDITRQAFANARNNPETLKNLLKSEIEKRILD